MDHLKEQIVKKASILFNKYGIRSITMDDISHEMGISKKTLYEHIQDKKDLVTKVINFELGEKEKAFRQIPEKGLNAVEELLEVNRVILELIKEYNPAKFRDLKKYYPDIYDSVRKTQRDRMFQSMIRNIRKGKAQGLYRDDVDEEVIAKLYVSRMEYPLESDLLTPREFTSPRFITQSFIYHIHGIANAKGLAFIDNYHRQISQNDKNEAYEI